MTIGQDFSDTMYYTRYAYVAEQIGKTICVKKLRTGQLLIGENKIVKICITLGTIYPRSLFLVLYGMLRLTFLTI